MTWTRFSARTTLQQIRLASDDGHAITVIGGLPARPDLTPMHLRNMCYGCDSVAVRRSRSSPPAPAETPGLMHCYGT